VVTVWNKEPRLNSHGTGGGRDTVFLLFTFQRAISQALNKNNHGEERGQETYFSLCKKGQNADNTLNGMVFGPRKE
jgi:hypothetical protein